ncbi:MAG: hypothetical protein ILP24_00765, partial [Paludibacteraceae bacterium]|nr:hypothetical protein [Paludibacteraceae bacterium]
MKKNILLFLLSVLAFSLQAQQRGYYDAPYVRYEADAATLGGGATVQSSYNQDQITFEASDRTSVLANNGGSVTWNNVAGNFNKVGITLRFAIAIPNVVNNRDGDVTRNVDLSINGTYITTLTLHSQWSWEHLWDNGNGNNNGISNQNYRMRFDEIRYRVDNSYNGPISITLKANGNGV